MQPTDDSSLLRQYAEDNSDEAFAALVTRRINLVYSVALRQVGNPHNAEEITQAVFIILAKKAAQLREVKSLSSWLFQVTRLTANNFVRSESRRHRREQEARMQSILNESETEVWPKIAPLLDTAVAGLREKDRQAIVLRFYEGRNLREVGLALGAREDAAEKRVNRALEKLRKFFTKRGVTLSAAAIAGAVSANSVHAAPVTLAKSVTAMAIAKGAVASASTLTLIKGALKIMAWTKMKTVAVVGVAVIFAAGSTTLAIHHEHRQRANNPMLMAGFSKSANQSLQSHWTGSNTAHPGQTCTLNISGDQIEYHGANPNDWLRGTFVLNENSDPKQINVTILEPANSFVFGIYQVTGDKMTIAVAQHGSSLRPVNFTPGPQVDVLELQHD
jgi:RNA polymerase sigma factor (sigma-70 family)